MSVSGVVCWSNKGLIPIVMAAGVTICLIVAHGSLSNSANLQNFRQLQTADDTMGSQSAFDNKKQREPFAHVSAQMAQDQTHKDAQSVNAIANRVTAPANRQLDAKLAALDNKLTALEQSQRRMSAAMQYMSQEHKKHMSHAAMLRADTSTVQPTMIESNSTKQAHLATHENNTLTVQPAHDATSAAAEWMQNGAISAIAARTQIMNATRRINGVAPSINTTARATVEKLSDAERASVKEPDDAETGVRMHRQSNANAVKREHANTHSSMQIQSNVNEVFNAIAERIALLQMQSLNATNETADQHEAGATILFVSPALT